MATLVLGDEDLNRKATTMSGLVVGVEKWHSDQAILNTSPEGSLRYPQEEARGKFWQGVSLAFELASDPAKLSDVGFLVGVPAALKTTLNQQHCLVYEENCWAALTVALPSCPTWVSLLLCQLPCRRL